jgi:membrane protease subunit HflK
MAWNPQGGGPFGGGGQGPWGRGPSGQRPPDLEELLRKSQDRFKRYLPGGFGGGRGLILAVLAVVGLWLVSGIYKVEPEQQGVVLMFGKWVETTPPGLHWFVPPPIGSVEKPQVTRVNRTPVGFRQTVPGQRSGPSRSVPQESLMLTGDENIIDIQSVTFWVIKDAGKYLFNVRNPDATVKDASEAALREIVGKSEFEFTRTDGRVEIEKNTKILIQAILDHYGAGIEVTEVQLQKVDPPGNVLDAFRDVQAARADKERTINEATAYYNEVLERSEGEAQRILKDAEGYREQKVAIATGQASRFLAVLGEYRNEKDVTRRRIYLDTMKTIMRDIDKVLIDSSTGAGGSGVVPYLPLDELRRAAREAAPAAAPKAGGS